MADDKDEKPSLVRRAWAFGKLKHNHPPPKDARPSYPELQPLTLGGPGPGGDMAPGHASAAPEPTPVPTAGVRPSIAATFARAARTPEETARLERGAQLRRDLLAQREDRAREGQAKAAREAADRLRQRLDDVQAEPVVRGVAEAALLQRQAEDVRAIDAFFTEQAAATEAVIDQAFETGAFADTLETMLSASFDRAAGHEVGHGVGDSGGRGQGD